jgi:hypothetical protein
MDSKKVSMLVQYVRDANKNPIATFVAFKKGDKFVFGWSKYNVKEEVIPFSKKIGKELAFIKATNKITLLVIDCFLRKITLRKNNPKAYYVYIPEDIEDKACSFLHRALRYFRCTVGNVNILKSHQFF